MLPVKIMIKRSQKIVTETRRSNLWISISILLEDLIKFNSESLLTQSEIFNYHHFFKITSLYLHYLKFSIKSGLSKSPH